MKEGLCPHCKKPAQTAGTARKPYHPFCSERCKMADLGMWFREEHRMPGRGTKSADGAEGKGPVAGEED